MQVANQMKAKPGALAIWAAVVLCLCGMCGKGYALDGYGVEVTLVSALVQKVSPGRRANFIFRVSNISERDIDFVGKVMMPYDFDAPAPDPFYFNLTSGTASTQEISIFVPKSVSSGRYSLRYLVEGKDNPVWEDSEEFVIEVD